MDERKLAVVPGEEDLGDALAFAMECMIDHAEKRNVAGLGTVLPSDGDERVVIGLNMGGIL